MDELEDMPREVQEFVFELPSVKEEARKVFENGFMGCYTSLYEWADCIGIETDDGKELFVALIGRKDKQPFYDAVYCKCSGKWFCFLWD